VIRAIMLEGSPYYFAAWTTRVSRSSDCTRADSAAADSSEPLKTPMMYCALTATFRSPSPRGRPRWPTRTRAARSC
jgi:hypothetical protein